MKKIISILFVVAVFGVSLNAQKAEDAIQKLYNDYPQEKVILTFSKNDYLAGETIFFKGYVLTGYQPTEVSSNLYVELWDRNKKLIDKSVLPLFRGSTEGSFVLPSSLAEDVYFIRAYTHWMLNFDPSLTYLRQMKVYNPYSSNRLQQKTDDWNVTAYPESNILLADIASRVAIRLSSQGSLPAGWQASLYDQSSTVPVVTVNSFNKEIGALDFLPEAGHEYFIKVTDNTGKTKEAALPQVQSNGVLLQVRNDSKLAYQVTFKIPSAGIGYKILGTINDQKVFSATVKKSNGVISSIVDTKDLPSGVFHFTLFDEKENVIAERLSFIDPLHLKLSQPQINADTLSNDPKAINHWRLEQDTLTWYTYAVQVQDANYPKPENFLSSLYLTSDLSMPVDEPSWYFDNMDVNKATALDALLMTEKWKRFNWTDLLQNKFPVIRIAADDKYLSYKATVTRRKKMEPIKDVNLIFQSKDSSIHFVQAAIDSSGHFYMDSVVFVDTVKVFFQLNSKKYAAKDIKIDFESLNTFAPFTALLPAVPYMLVPRNKNDSVPAHIVRADATRNMERLANEKFKMMEEVVIRYSKKSVTEELDKKLSSGLFQTDNAMIFDFINNDQTSALGYSNILEWLQGRVPGLQVTTKDGIPIPIIRGSQASIFVDEMGFEPEYLQGFSISDIAMVKVIRGTFLGSTGNGAAIAIYTKRGDLRARFTTPELPFNYLVGYKKQPAFFAPDYSTNLYKDFNDNREILFRKSLLIPGLNTFGVIRFNNNDVTRTFRVLITGFAADGTPVYVDKLIEPKKL